MIGILTHLTDSTQNQEFAAKYFSGVKIDLSRVLFIFSYNNPENIDPILLDRIHRVKFKSLKKQEKIYISKNYMLPEICKTVGFDKEQIIISDDIIENIIELYTYESGVRRLRERFIEIIREVNLRYITNSTLLGSPITLPFTFTMEHLDKDILSITSTSLSPKNITVNFLGEIENPGTLKLDSNTTLIDGILAAGGPKNWRSNYGNVEILRINRNGSAFRKRYRIDLSQNYSEKNNPILNNGDSIWVRRNNFAKATATLSAVSSPLRDLVNIWTLFKLID